MDVERVQYTHFDYTCNNISWAMPFKFRIRMMKEAITLYNNQGLIEKFIQI